MLQSVTSVPLTFKQYNQEDLQKLPADVWRIILEKLTNFNCLHSTVLTCKAWCNLTQQHLEKFAAYKHSVVLIRSVSLIDQQIHLPQGKSVCQLVKELKVDVELLSKKFDEILTYFNPQNRILVYRYKDLLLQGPQILDELKARVFIGGSRLYQPQSDLLKYNITKLFEFKTTLPVSRNTKWPEVCHLAREMISKYIEEFKDFFGEMGQAFAEVNASEEGHRKSLVELFEKYRPELEGWNLYLTPLIISSFHDRGRVGLWVGRLDQTYEVNIPPLLEIVNYFITAPANIVRSYELQRRNGNSKKEIQNFLLDIFKSPKKNLPVV